jgi:hypothetical protein
MRLSYLVSQLEGGILDVWKENGGLGQVSLGLKVFTFLKVELGNLNILVSLGLGRDLSEIKPKNKDIQSDTNVHPIIMLVPA